MITKEWCQEVMRGVSAEGPCPKDYAAVAIALHWIYGNIKNPQNWFLDNVITAHREFTHEEDLIGVQTRYDLLLHIWDKPRGYNGDGGLLQKMYDCLSVPDYDPQGWPYAPYAKSLWDHYFCARPEMLALQHRRWMFEEHLEYFIDKGARSLVDLGCGNGSFANHAYDRLRQFPNGRVLGIDNDMLPVHHWDRPSPYFVKANVLKYEPAWGYDIVYSGGLFDYFNDKLFRRMLRRTMLYNPKFIMIGNIEQSEYTKAFIGCLGWKLFDRTRWDLLQLTVGIFEPEQVEVHTDFTGHQHFLQVTL